MRKTKEPEIKVGDRVYVKRMMGREHKFQSFFLGPFRVVEKKGQSVKVRNLMNHKISEVHLSMVLLVKEENVEEESGGKTKPRIFPEEEWYELEMGSEEPT